MLLSHVANQEMSQLSPGKSLRNEHGKEKGNEERFFGSHSRKLKDENRRNGLKADYASITLFAIRKLPARPLIPILFQARLRQCQKSACELRR